MYLLCLSPNLVTTVSKSPLHKTIELYSVIDLKMKSKLTEQYISTYIGSQSIREQGA
jgi:hypothetical protein